MIAKTISSWKALIRKFMHKLISTAIIVHTYLSLLTLSLHSQVRTWFVFIKMLLKMNENYLCVIFNTLILRRRLKISCNITLLLVIYLWWRIKNNQLEIINWFMWIIMNFFCIFLLGWWWGETISDLFLNLDLGYVPFSLINVNYTSLLIPLNTISEFWSVYKILSKKSS